MVPRFRGKIDPVELRRDGVITWMSEFIDEAERRKHAWNRWKDEAGDDGLQCDPSLIPNGIGPN
jgi:hypothetical protein